MAADNVTIELGEFVELPLLISNPQHPLLQAETAGDQDEELGGRGGFGSCDFFGVAFVLELDLIHTTINHVGYTRRVIFKTLTLIN